MSVSRFLIVLISLMLPLTAHAQGFAGLGTSGDGYASVEQKTVLTFPQDHSAHPDFRIEWWYVTANLTDAAGNAYGIQWTLFRQAFAPPPQRDNWQNQQMWLGHAALTSKTQHFSAETLARGLTGQAGVSAAPFSAWIDDWHLSSTARPGFSHMAMAARGDDFAYTLDLQTKSPLVLHGVDGFSRKSELGQASHYYSQPFYEVSGEIEMNGKAVEVTGQAWLDREWSSQPLAASQTGWDWFSLHLDGGDKLMLFRLRDDAGNDYFSGTWIDDDGKPTPLGPDDIRFTPQNLRRVAGRDLPTEWLLEVPSKQLRVTTRALNEQSWMETSIPYWEGAVSVSGSHTGVGFLEMTGYVEK
ncbi:MAG: iron ABC transporter permease [Hyphomicrobiales bacterium]|nr:MAG: iron ABC transporter permease [Hyphomicrobiales bacterium]